MTFKLNCAPEAGRLTKMDCIMRLLRKIGRQMGASRKNAFITFSSYTMDRLGAKLAHCYCNGAIVLCSLSGRQIRGRDMFSGDRGGRAYRTL